MTCFELIYIYIIYNKAEKQVSGDIVRVVRLIDGTVKLSKLHHKKSVSFILTSDCLIYCSLFAWLSECFLYHFTSRKEEMYALK